MELGKDTANTSIVYGLFDVSFMVRVTNKRPQSLIRNTWGQMCFGIQNFSGFRTAIRCTYRILRDTASRLWDSAVL